MEALAFLLGSWRGAGYEEYPTVDDTEYEEELGFEDSGTGFLAYRQRAWRPADGQTLHAEAGFWRLAEDGTVEVALGHPLGVAEISEGTVSGGEVALSSRSVARTSTGEPVTGVARLYRVEGDVLTYEIAMALDHVPMTHHLRATLRRVP
jgi:THAP4-like, heme-binding beta-barrel domain